METLFTPSGTHTRKQLAEIIGAILGVKPTYLGAPTMAYQVDDVEVSRYWRVRWPEAFPSRDIDLIEAVATGEGFKVTREGEETPTEGLTLVFPTARWSERTRRNLEAMLSSKTALITKALSIDAVPAHFDEDTVSFPWFQTTPTQQVAEATTLLLSAMIDAATRASRVSPKPPAGSNEKYAMRCFLLRLGFIGDTHKAARRVLLARLEGSAAWATPPTKPTAMSEVAS